MKTHVLPDGLRRLLLRSVAHRYYSLVVTAVAFAATITFSFPFVAVLVPAVLLAPRRWCALGLLSGIASGCGAAVLVEIFQYLGEAFVVAHYPELVHSEAWRLVSDWLQQWGLVAMLIIAGSPLPQTPALLFCALADVSTLGILVAVGVGKTTKYLTLAWATARYPARFMRYN
jgi:membrane protein YqaA with SNARE-associated domain